jgi:hypothetical protein
MRANPPRRVVNLIWKQAFSIQLRRRSAVGALGAVLAAIALLAQIAGPTLHPPLLNASAKGFGDFFAAFDAHALCLTPDAHGPGSATPAGGAPKVDHGSATCCFWHGSAGFAPSPAAIIERVAFWSVRIAFAVSAENVPTRLSGTFRARAPPLGA